jgi:tape measure domain-containing protein
MATERIQIVVTERGAREVRRNLEDIGSSASSAGGAVTLLKRALGGIGVGLLVRELTLLADTYTNIQNRLKVVTNGSAELRAVTEELFRISNETRSSFEATASIYSRVALAAANLGRSQRELLDFSESLNQAVILSGASAREAEGALIQLSQGLASGTLQGDELRSVLEQLPLVADVIADYMTSLGRFGTVTRGELRTLAKEGAVTAEIVLDAFKGARGELAELFAQTTPTIEQSLTVLKNRFMELWGEFITTSALAQTVAQGILWIGENLDNIIPLVVATGAAFAAWTIGSSIAAVLGPLIALERALGASSLAAALFGISMKGAQAAVNSFTVAIAANPLGALLVAITATIALLYTFGDEIKVTEDGVVSLQDVFVATFQLIGESLSQVTAYFQAAWEATFEAVDAVLRALGTTFETVLGAVLAFAKAFANNFIGLFAFAGRAIQIIWNNFPGFMDQIFVKVVNLGATAAEALLNAWQVPLRLIAGGLSLIDDEAGAALNGFLNNFNINIPRAQLSDAGRQVGEDLAAAAGQAFTTDYIGNAADVVMARARQIAEARNAEQPVDLTQAGTALPRELEEAEKKTKKLKDAEEEAREALARFLLEIDREIELLGMSNRERERAEMLYRLEDEMKRRLTDTERELVNARIDSLQVARDQRYLKDYVQDLEDENMLLQYTGREHEIRAGLLRVERDLGRELTPVEQEYLRTLLGQNEALRNQNDLLESTVGARQAFYDDLSDVQALLADPTSGFTSEDAFNSLAGGDLAGFFEGTRAQLDATLATYQTYYDQISAMRDANLIDQESAAQALANVEVAMLEARLQQQKSFFGTLAQLSSSKNRELAAIGKAAAITQATIDGYLAVQKALSAFPPPFNFIAAAAVGAATAANVAGILSQNANFMTGGSMRVGGSGGPDSQMVAFRASPGEQIDVRTPHQVRKGTGSFGEGGGDGGSPQLNARIVNVLDPALVGDFLETPEGEQMLINVMRRNGDAVRSISQGG